MSTCPFGTRRTSRWIPWLSIAVPSIGWLTFGLYPSLATVYYSFTNYSGLPGTPETFCGLCNYRNMFTSNYSQLSQAVVTTLEYVGGVTVLQIVIGLGLALVLQRRRFGFGFYRALIFMPQIFSVTIVGVLFSLLLDPTSGPAETVYHSVIGGYSSFLGDSDLAIWLIVLVNVWMFSGYTMLVYIAGLRRIPPELYEAAALDGAGAIRRFWRITWPMLAPATTVNVFLTVMGSLGEYALILVLTQGQYHTQTLGMFMFNTAFGANPDLGLGSMLAMVQFVLTAVIGSLLLWVLRRREVSL
ncbi:carbohydrate ABC transporter permease [Streptacidiphilus sp. P02-A3a]|uniref:carbohydrate ABC transporter permease n=1 Tax=Streptacidiphilus sp. P02-A3a TaxID=2704468 RepID=UPI0015FE0BA5|nr:sugar ABC transporter permease [Streptacidiphilus sp. P02-A3a]QMU69362.1 sugar ABC transporter permease [Streptacidiphilus sp. P02-A3a]